MKSLSKIRFCTIAAAFFSLFAAMFFSLIKTDFEKESIKNFSLSVAVGEESIKLVPWEDEDGTYYLFVPSGIKERNSALLEDYEKEWNVRYDKTLKILCSENIPSLLITVADKEDLLSETEFAKKKYIENGELLVLDENGNLMNKSELAQFKVRGNLTATLDKKPFKMLFNEPTSVIGMAPAIKWNLIANATDGSYIRNKLVLDLANSVTEAYEPDGEFAELYLNGSYQGLYLVTEAVETGENRLDISGENDYLLEMELDFRMEEDTTYVITDKGQIFGINTENMVTQEEAEQIAGFLNDIEDALFSENGVSQISGKSLEELIDLDSWVDAWLIQEISGDHDTGIASQFAYIKTEQGKQLLYAGPVWDFDGSMGNVNTPMFKNPKALITSIEQTREEGNVNQNRWLAAMYQNEKFRQLLVKKYQSVFDAKLKNVVEEKIDEYVSVIRRSACLDALRWHEQRFTWEFVIPENIYIDDEENYSRYDTLEEHIDMVKNFLSEKRSFLYGLLIENRDYCIVEIRNEAPFLNQDYNQTLYDWVERGTAISNLPKYYGDGYEFKGYYDVDTGQLIENGTFIYRDCILEGIWERTGEN